MRFLKIRTSKDAIGGAKTLYLSVEVDTPAIFFGRAVNPKTAEDTSYVRKDGVIVDMKHMIFKTAIAWTQEMKEDLKYGGLVPVGVRHYSP